MPRALPALALALALAAPAQAAEWRTRSEDGLCFVDTEIGRAGSRPGVTLALGLNPAMSFFVVVTNPTWSLEDGASYPVEISIDGGAPWTGPAHAVGTATIAAVWHKADAELMRPFAYGSRLRLEARHRFYEFPLAGSFEAIRRLLQCVAEAPSRANPFR
jgi:hypothetical protein